MTLLTIPMVLTLSFLFTRLSHPLSLGMNLLIQTVFMSLTVRSNFYLFVLILLYSIHNFPSGNVGSLYLRSLSSLKWNLLFLFNNIFNLQSYYHFSFFCLFTPWPLVSPNLSSLPVSSLNNHLSTPLIVSRIYNSPSMSFTLFIIMYLLLTLVVVVSIIDLFNGPLRLSN